MVGPILYTMVYSVNIDNNKFDAHWPMPFYRVISGGGKLAGRCSVVRNVGIYLRRVPSGADALPMVS
jgi:hypothetical protein